MMNWKEYLKFEKCRKKRFSPLNFHHLPRGVIGCY